jgi:hypothetical protein
MNFRLGCLAANLSLNLLSLQIPPLMHHGQDEDTLFLDLKKIKDTRKIVA